MGIQREGEWQKFEIRGAEVEQVQRSGKDGKQGVKGCREIR